jgi:hypothetical protein
VTWLFVVALGAGAVVWLTEDEEPRRSPDAAPAVAADPVEPSDRAAADDAPTRGMTVAATATTSPDVEPEAVADAQGPDPDTWLDDDAHELEEPPADAPRPAPNPRLVPRKTAGDPQGWTGRSNPRTAPPGTEPDNIEALARLPVGRADRPAVGGVGAMGIHVDRIMLGSMYDTGRCTGDPSEFSASRHDRVSACFRVVHPRTTQRVTVLWQRDNETLRRTWMTIPAAHAYRTRAFIVLRDDDAGRWKVRVVSTDGVELASAAFEVR